MSDAAAPWSEALRVATVTRDRALFEAVRAFHPIALMADGAAWASYHLRLRKEKPHHGTT